MFRMPYCLRKVEGIRIPFLGKYWYEFNCRMENRYIKKAIIIGNPLNSEERDETITVSLTSFPSRIGVVEYAIKSLMLQTYKPDRIVLWLANDQFKSIQLPNSLIELQNFGLEIRYCDDLKGHKKYYYALQEQQKKELVITYDDDIIYETDSIEKLVMTHKKFNNCLVCNRGYEITYDSSKKFRNYKEWKLITNEGLHSPSMKITASTGAGCLYPYGCLKDSVFDRELIFKYALSADDLWIKYNCLLSGTKVVKTKKYIATLCNIDNSQSEALTNLNNLQGQNDITLKALNALTPGIFNLN